MWRIVQHPQADDFVLATGELHSVREFVECAFRCVGRAIDWTGRGINEVGLDRQTGKTLICVDRHYYRPTEVDTLLGDPAKAGCELDWVHKTSFTDLVSEMVESDMQSISDPAWRKLQAAE